MARTALDFGGGTSVSTNVDAGARTRLDAISKVGGSSVPTKETTILIGRIWLNDTAGPLIVPASPSLANMTAAGFKDVTDPTDGATDGNQRMFVIIRTTASLTAPTAAEITADNGGTAYAPVALDKAKISNNAGASVWFTHDGTSWGTGKTEATATAVSASKTFDIQRTDNTVGAPTAGEATSPVDGDLAEVVLLNGAWYKYTRTSGAWVLSLWQPPIMQTDAGEAWKPSYAYAADEQFSIRIPATGAFVDSAGKALTNGELYNSAYPTAQTSGAVFDIPEAVKTKFFGAVTASVSPLTTIRDAATATNDRAPGELAVRTELDALTARTERLPDGETPAANGIYTQEIGFTHVAPALTSGQRATVITKQADGTTIQTSYVHDGVSQVVSISGAPQSNPVMVGATATTPGDAGIVPAPAIGDQNRFLTGAGTYQDISVTGQTLGGFDDPAKFPAIPDNASDTVLYNLWLSQDVIGTGTAENPQWPSGVYMPNAGFTAWELRGRIRSNFPGGTAGGFMGGIGTVPLMWSEQALYRGNLNHDMGRSVPALWLSTYAAYQSGDLVKSAVNDLWYRALVDNPEGEPSVTPNAWVSFVPETSTPISQHDFGEVAPLEVSSISGAQPHLEGGDGYNMVAANYTDGWQATFINTTADPQPVRFAGFNGVFLRDGTGDPVASPYMVPANTVVEAFVAENGGKWLQFVSPAAAEAAPTSSTVRNVTGSITASSFEGNTVGYLIPIAAGTQLDTISSGIIEDARTGRISLTFGATDIALTHTTTQWRRSLSATVGGSAANVNNKASIDFDATIQQTVIVSLPSGRYMSEVTATNATITGFSPSGSVSFMPNNAGSVVLTATTTASSTSKASPVSTLANAGVWTTIGSIRFTVPTSGNRSMQVTALTGTINIKGTTWWSDGGGVVFSTSTSISTGTYLEASWNFGSSDNWQQAMITDTTNGRTYFIFVGIGWAYNNNEWAAYEVT